jgi:hypothetical protein
VSKSIVTGQLGGSRMCIIVHFVLPLSLVAVHFGRGNHQPCDLEDKALHLEAAFYAVEVGSGTSGFRDQMSGIIRPGWGSVGANAKTRQLVRCWC